MVKYSFPLVPNSIGWSIINISDRLLITFFIGTGANGIYAMANKFPNIINTFSGFFFTAFKENASKAIKKDNYKNYYDNIQEIVHKAFITISILLITGVPFIFNIFINKAYIQAYDYIPILVIALYYGNMSGFYGSLFVAFKETKIIGRSTIVGALINLGINLLLIKFMGIYAAAISTLISNYVVNWYRKKKINNFFELGHIKYYYTSIILLFLLSGLFYFKLFIVNVISIVLAIIYSFVANKNLIKDIISLFKGRLKR